MTDFSLPQNNHTVPVAESIVSNGISPNTATADQLPPAPTVDEEDYTIKCICGFYDDDGNTVFCDRCETWQHTECYYFEDGEVPDVSGIDHWCADCNPRQLDAQGAMERQSIRREQPDLGERKVKKTTTKSHKKKIKLSDTTVPASNGWNHDRNDYLAFPPDRASGSPRDNAPSAKRPKISHRYSGSMNSSDVSHGFSDKRSGSSSRVTHSPAKTTSKSIAQGHPIEPYSQEFLHLYDDDPGDATMQANLFNDITITRSLSLWTQDAEALAKASNGLSPQDIFHRCDQPLDSMVFPFLHKKYKSGDGPDFQGHYPRWTYLTTDSPLVKGSIVGELKGKIGHMRDYVQDSTNRWDYLRHPVPFVFFHPKLPIYIDTRREGSTCRYLRRSCRPNLTMTTILENGSDYRFCFVAKDDLEAGSELTIGWTLDQHMRNFFHRRNTDQIKNEGAVDADEEYVSDWVGKVLADFGGCTCNAPDECSLARYDRRHRLASNGSSSTSNGSHAKGRSGHNKRQPPNIEQATYSASITTKYREDEDEDGRSASGSTRSKPRSRDLTPTRNTAWDAGLATGVEISDRDKRKIAAVEKNFEQIEQEKHQSAHKKKKRNSSGPSINASTASAPRPHGHGLSVSQPNSPAVAFKSQYFDASTFQRTLDSPVGKTTYSQASHQAKASGRRKRPSYARLPPANLPSFRQNYVTSSVQTDPDLGADWYKTPAQQNSRKPFMSLTKRLLLRSQQDRIRMEQRLGKDPTRTSYGLQASHHHGSELPQEPAAVAMRLDLPPHANMLTNIVEQQKEANPMPRNIAENLLIRKPRPPDPERRQTEGKFTEMKPLHSFNKPINGYRLTDLRIQPTLTPQLANEPQSDSPKDVTTVPTNARSPLVQPNSIFPSMSSTSTSSVIQPSPVKKVSLGEYISRRSNKNDAQHGLDKPTGSSPVLQSGSLKPIIGMEVESKYGAIELNSIGDIPRMEEAGVLEDLKDGQP